MNNFLFRGSDKEITLIVVFEPLCSYHTHMQAGEALCHIREVKIWRIIRKHLLGLFLVISMIIFISRMRFFCRKNRMPKVMTKVLRLK